MKKKKELINSEDPELNKLKIMNFKTQEQILYENALRGVLSTVPDGNLYKRNGACFQAIEDPEPEPQPKKTRNTVSFPHCQ